MECRRSQVTVGPIPARRVARSWIMREELDGAAVTFTSLVEDMERDALS